MDGEIVSLLHGNTGQYIVTNGEQVSLSEEVDEKPTRFEVEKTALGYAFKLRDGSYLRAGQDRLDINKPPDSMLDGKYLAGNNQPYVFTVGKQRP